MNKSSQQGLTLLELMVALVLGLLIVAAGLAVFLNAQRAMGFQPGWVTFNKMLTLVYLCLLRTCGMQI